MDDSPATGVHLTANSDVDGGTAPDLPAGPRRISERSAGCRVSAAAANDSASRARPRAAQDRYAGGDERYFLFAAYRPPLALSGGRQLSVTLEGARRAETEPLRRGWREGELRDPYRCFGCGGKISRPARTSPAGVPPRQPMRFCAKADGFLTRFAILCARKASSESPLWLHLKSRQ